MRLTLEPTRGKEDGEPPKIIIEKDWDCQTDPEEIRDAIVAMLTTWGWQLEYLNEVFGVTK